ncbi:MAG: hypothetical protein ACPGUD_10590 [Parashewanella sp.]
MAAPVNPSPQMSSKLLTSLVDDGNSPHVNTVVVEVNGKDRTFSIRNVNGEYECLEDKDIQSDGELALYLFKAFFFPTHIYATCKQLVLFFRTPSPRSNIPSPETKFTFAKSNSSLDKRVRAFYTGQKINKLPAWSNNEPELLTQLRNGLERSPKFVTAIKDKKYDEAAQLMDRGVDLLYRDADGKTAIDYLRRADNEEARELWNRILQLTHQTRVL